MYIYIYIHTQLLPVLQYVLVDCGLLLFALLLKQDTYQHMLVLM